MKEHEEKWLAIGKVRQEAVLSGEIKSTAIEKQRFYYHRYIYVQTLKLQTATKLITAKKITPITKDIKLSTFYEGEVLRIYGCFEGTTFFFDHFEKLSTVKQI